MTRRIVRGYTMLGTPAPHSTPCPRCDFDSLLAFPAVMLSEAGVTTFGHVLKCGRCAEEAGE